MNVCFLYSKVSGGAKKLGLRPEMMRRREGTFVMDALANRHDLRTVGELYDFLCERGMSNFADAIFSINL